MRILLVVGDPAGLASDGSGQAQFDHWSAAGHSITLQDADLAPPSTMNNDYDLVVISNSCSSSMSMTAYDPLTIPVLATGIRSPHSGYALAIPTNGPTQTTQYVKTQGLGDPIVPADITTAQDVTLLDTAFNTRYVQNTSYGAGVHQIACTDSANLPRLTMTRYDTGDTMYTGTAPSKRAWLMIHAGSIGTSGRGWEFLDNALTWMAPASTSYGSEVLADSPVAFYRLDESIGTVMADSSGNGRNGTYAASGIALGAAPLIGGSASSANFTNNGPVNKGGGSVTAASWMDPGPNGLTVVAWIRPTALTNLAHFVAARDDDQTSFSLRLWNLSVTPSGALAGMWGDNTTGRDTLTTADGLIVVGGTYHVAMTINKSTGVATLYINGAAVASKSTTGPRTSSASNFPLRVGSSNSAAPDRRDFIGLIDEFAFYNTTLSATRIEAHYAAGIAAVIAAQIESVYTEALVTATSPPAQIESVYVESLTTNPASPVLVGTLYVEVLTPASPSDTAPPAFYGWGIPI